MKQQAQNPYLQALKQTLKFVQNPPTIEEAIDSEYYLKNVIPPVYPFWRKRLKELFPDNITSKSSYVILTGAIGGGKSTFSQIVLLYDIIRLTCLKSVEEVSRIGASQGFFIKISNIYKNKAEDFAQTVISAVFGGGSPFFQNELAKGNKFLKKLKINAVGSREKDIVSNDVIGFHLSEINELSQEKALSLVSSASSRLTSRFLTLENLFVHLIVDSSTKGTNAATEALLRNDPKFSSSDCFSVRVNSWNTTEGLKRYFNYGSFEVYSGDAQNNPFVVPKDFTEADRLRFDRDRFITCPMELYPEAVRNITLFLQEKCGIASNSSSKFFTDHGALDRAFCLDMESDEVIRVDFFDKFDTVMEKVKEDIAKLPHDRKVYVKIDMGVASDLCGVAVAYSDGLDRTIVDGINTDRLIIEIPLCFGVSRYSGQETPINKIEDFILQLNQVRTVAMVLTDQFQCFTGDTKVSLLSGEEEEIERIVSRVQDGEVLYAYSLDLDRNRIAPGRIIDARCTGFKPICKVTLDNGEVVRCTYDHRFMLRDGSYCEAKDLKPGTSFMSFCNGEVNLENYTVTSVKLTDEIAPVYDLTIENFHNFALSAGVFVHNCTELRQIMIQNGIPAKLQSVDRNDSAYVTAKNYIYSGLVRLPKNDRLKVEAEEVERVDVNKIDHPFGGCFTGDSKVLVRNRVTSEVTDIQMDELVSSYTDFQVLTFNGSTFEYSDIKVATETKRTDILMKLEFDDIVYFCTPDHKFLTLEGWKEAKDLSLEDELVSSRNVKLLSKEAVTCSKVPVYDLETVSDNHNFCLSNGVVVHNSKDLLDCCVGLIAHMVEEGPEKVLEPPESQLADDMVDIYSQISEIRQNRNITHMGMSMYSDYLNDI